MWIPNRSLGLFYHEIQRIKTFDAATFVVFSFCIKSARTIHCQVPVVVSITGEEHPRAFPDFAPVVHHLIQCSSGIAGPEG